MLAKAFLVGAVALLLICNDTVAAEYRSSLPAAALPAGVGIKMTVDGPIFVDGRGMALYRRNFHREFGMATCTDRPETRLNVAIINYNQVTDFPMSVPDAKSRRSCIEKYPPFLAQADAKPVGDWTLVTVGGGARQWAYRGAPLHTSIKDKISGEINAGDSGGLTAATSWSVVFAPSPMPSGIDTRLTASGLAFTNYKGQTLYYLDAGVTARPDIWQPLLAPAAATGNGYPDWSIVNQAGVSRQWAYKGKPVYTYVDDSGDEPPQGGPATPFVDTFGEPYGKPIAGWHVALLRAAPRHPAEVRVDPGLAFVGTRVYTDAKGMTLYIMHCVEGTNDRLDCDDVGDSPRYWISFCGGEEQCRKNWRPLIAPADAKPIDGVWSVMTINPNHPWRPLQAGETGLQVWAYRGRPVFTHAQDKAPGDTRGVLLSRHSTIGSSQIVAFADHRPDDVALFANEPGESSAQMRRK